MKREKNQLSGYSVIIGCGRLGASLANDLSDENKDVIIVDRDKSAFRKLSPSYGGLTLIGDATDLDILIEAGIEKASLVIVVTNNDNTNIMISQISKKQFKVEKVITRLYDPERTFVYDDQEIKTISPLILSTNKIKKLINIIE